MMTSQTAKELAILFHTGQTRADKVTAYIEHPKAVVNLIKQYNPGYIDYDLSIGWLHDVFEESLDKVCEKYNIDIPQDNRVNLEYVLNKEWGTAFTQDLIKLSDNWPEDKEKIFYRGKVAYLAELLISSYPYLVFIKLCDMLANIQESNGSHLSQEKRYYNAIQCLKAARRKDLYDIHFNVISEIERLYLEHKNAAANNN